MTKVHKLIRRKTVELLIGNMKEPQVQYRLRIPYPNNMFITGNQHWLFIVKSTMPFNIQY